MAGNGGWRPGSGRKPKKEKYNAAIQAAEGQIRDRLPMLIDKLFELAEGVTVQELKADGSPLIYTRPPDRQAAEYLVNRVMGKPVEKQEHGWDQEKPVEVVVIHESG